MISLLKGTIFLLDSPYIIIDVSGVGYRVLASHGVLQSVHVGDQATVYIYTQVREDALDLYGFVAYQDLKLFEQLISVSGIGPKTAIGVFALGSSGDIMSAIATGNVSFFSSVPRLGKKNAQKIIIELKNKIGSRTDIDLSEGGSDSEDIVQALQTFGYSAREAMGAVTAIKDEGKTTEQKIKLALKHLGK